MPRLITLDEFKDLSPFHQGFVVYMQANHPGSELKGKECPYSKGTKEYEDYQRGQFAGVLEAQDSEE